MKHLFPLALPLALALVACSRKVPEKRTPSAAMPAALGATDRKATKGAWAPW